jgi:hypothetical protein
MTDVPAPLTPAPMEGHGAYNRSSRVQAGGLSPALPLLKQAARAVPLAAAPEPIVIADYGCSEGHNSLSPMAGAIGALRERTGPDRAISVVHIDQPGNDFNALFQLLAHDRESYLAADPAVFASAVGRSFYEQVLPANSVTIGWSSWAVQWLSRIPAVIPDHIQVAFSSDAAARAAFAQQAAEDWRRFLALRARETRSGGRLVLLTMATDDAGDFGYRAVVQAMYGALMSLAEEGIVHREDARRMAIPTFGRSRVDFMAPFGADGHFAGWTVEAMEIFAGEDRIWAEFEQSGDGRVFGARWAAFARASVFPTLAAELDRGPADPPAANFVDRLEAEMAARLAAVPEPTLIPLAKILLVKDG